MENKHWFDPIYDECRKLRSIACSLTEMSEASYVLGNNRMGRVLNAMSEAVRSSQDAIFKAASSQVSEEFRQSEQATHNMLATALAVASKTGDGKQR